MFAPIGAYPIGGIDESRDTQVTANGSIGVTGSASATVLVTGTLTQSLSLTGQATSQDGDVEAGDLLGFGPLASGAIAEMFSTTTVLSTRTGAASGTLSISGAGSAVLPIFARAPDIVLAQWVVVPSDSGATIASAPAPPLTPAWAVTVAPPGFSVVDYPNYTELVTSVPFLGITLSAQASTSLTLSASGSFPVTGQSGVSVRVSGAAGGQFDATGSAAAAAKITGTASAQFDISGPSTAVIGVVPLTATVTADFQISSASSVAVGVSGAVSQVFDISASASSGTGIFGQIAASIDFSATAAITQPSQRRVANARQSLNGGRVLSSQIPGSLEV